MNRNNLHLGVLPSPIDDSFTCTDSDASEAERLRWRNHPQIISPNPELVQSNPFDKEILPFPSSSGSRDVDAWDEKSTRGHEDVDLGRYMTGGAGGRQGGLNGQRGEEDVKNNLGWRERIRHFTWTWFCMTMATGGIANVLYTVPFRFRGLYAIGCIFFILNIVLFIFNVVMISFRFYFFPKTFRASFLHPTESLFIPAAIVSFGIILINISQYGVNTAGTRVWLEKCMIVLFWMDCGLAVSFSIGIYLIMWSTQTFTISQMTPVWIFPAYPLLIIGPHAGNLAPKVADPTRALSILLTGYVIQGIGFLVSLMIYSAFLYRLMTQKLPKESLRPGMFISVGPSGFTIAGIVNMGQQLPKVVPTDFMGEDTGELAGKVGMICGNFVGLWLWGLALWFFLISVGAHWSCARRGKMDFAMTWYSFVFPNTALTTATFAIAKALDKNKAINYIGCAMTIGLVVLWLFVAIMNVRAVAIRQVLWPQKQEDRTEGGWTQQSAEEQRRLRADTTTDGGERGRSRARSLVSLKKRISARQAKGGGDVGNNRGGGNWPRFTSRGGGS